MKFNDLKKFGDMYVAMDENNMPIYGYCLATADGKVTSVITDFRVFTSAGLPSCIVLPRLEAEDGNTMYSEGTITLTQEALSKMRATSAIIIPEGQSVAILRPWEYKKGTSFNFVGEKGSQIFLMEPMYDELYGNEYDEYILIGNSDVVEDELNNSGCTNDYIPKAVDNGYVYKDGVTVFLNGFLNVKNGELVGSLNQGNLGTQAGE